MNIKYLLSLSFAFCFGTALVAQQSVNVRIAENYDQSNCEEKQYCADLQLNLNGNGAELLGNSSIRFNYDASAVKFKGNMNEVTQGAYISRNFDENTTCGNIPPYAKHSFDGLIEGDFLLSIMLKTAFSSDCSSLISQDWATVSTICFDVVDENKSPDFKIVGSENGTVKNLAGTNFNSKENNPGTKYHNGTFNNLTSTFAEVCAAKADGVTGLSTIGQGWEIISLQPVPVKDNLVVELRSDKNDDVSIQIFDLSGKVVQEINDKLATGTNQLQVNTSNMSAGAYLISIRKSNEVLAQKFIKE